jgi:DNA repair protein RecN (Recombination protein N)
LHIEKFALIDKLTVFFGDGLNILTGETGAGKSIIIDALNQVLGERASAELVRAGTDKAILSAVFDVPAPAAAKLEELGLGSDESTIILQREIFANGKSQARIDGRPTNVTVLREIGSLLVEIHGQHEHQSLLDPSAHIGMLDAFGGQIVLDACSQYREAWKQLMDLKKELVGLHGDKRERERLLDMLQYQVDEIEKACLQEGEEELLLNERKLLQNARKLMEVCEQGYQTLYQGEGDNPVVQVLATVVEGLKSFRSLDGILEQACAQLEESLYSVEDAARQLRGFADNFSFDPGRLEEVEKRLDLINDLKRKYADTVAGILAWRDEKSAEIEAIRNTETRHAELSELVSQAAQTVGEAGFILSNLRRQAGKELAEAVEQELEYLHMSKTRFAVEASQHEEESGIPVAGKNIRASADGIDDIRFMISPNPGEPLKPLAKIASGGEMSRIMLAILNILAKLRPIQTMVFDEIDAGIGGRAAQAVAEKLADVSTQRQVICVSHLPQVSSMADTHLHIYKEADGDRTFTKVIRLDMEGRVEELARMLGGAEVTPATLRHSKEMLSLASKIKSQRM